MEATLSVTVSADSIDEFARVSGDCSPVHIDDEQARREGFAGRIAHGGLLVAYVSQLIGVKLPGPGWILHSLSMEYRQPVYPGDTVTILGRVKSFSEGVGLLTLKIEVAGGDSQLIATGMVRSIFRGVVPATE